MARPGQKAPPQKQNSELAALKEAQAATDKKLDQLLEVVGNLSNSVSAQNQTPVIGGQAPGIISRYHDAHEQELGGVKGAAEFSEYGGEQQLIQTVEGDLENPGFKEKLENLAFNEQFLDVEILTTNDKDAAKVFEVWVNGEGVVLTRGKRHRIKRKFIEVLARARPVNYQNEEYLGTDGLKHVRYPSESGLLYQFSLIGPTQRDMSWLNSILAQV